MRYRCLVFFFLPLLSFPTFASAELPDFHPPDPSASFDDIDDATRQGEITKQAGIFLKNLQNHWGDNPEQLRTSIAGSGESNEQGALVYLRNIAEHGVLEVYEFRRGSLIRGQYMIVQRPVNGLNEFIGYYSALKQTLTDTYGQPTTDRVVWDNDLYRPVPNYWGVAVMSGHLHYHAAWATGDGVITLELTGNHHSKLRLEYLNERAGTPA
ncbi:hypothetical protein [Petrachloros mirabilis]